MSKKSNVSFWKKRKAIEEGDKKTLDKINKKEIKEKEKSERIKQQLNANTYVWNDSKRNTYKLSRIKAFNGKTGRIKNYSFEGVKFPKGDDDFIQIDAIIKTTKFDKNNKPISKLVRTYHSESRMEVSEAVEDLSNKLSNILVNSPTTQIEILGIRVFVFYKDEFKIFDSKTQTKTKRMR